MAFDPGWRTLHAARGAGQKPSVGARRLGKRHGKGTENAQIRGDVDKNIPVLSPFIHFLAHFGQLSVSRRNKFTVHVALMISKRAWWSCYIFRYSDDRKDFYFETFQ
jgi:hypothetical protein